VATTEDGLISILFLRPLFQGRASLSAQLYSTTGELPRGRPNRSPPQSGILQIGREEVRSPLGFDVPAKPCKFQRRLATLRWVRVGASQAANPRQPQRAFPIFCSPWQIKPRTSALRRGDTGRTRNRPQVTAAVGEDIWPSVTGSIGGLIPRTLNEPTVPTLVTALDRSVRASCANCATTERPGNA
jgi:hypothetical protein